MPPRGDELERELRQETREQLRDHERRIQNLESSSAAMAVRVAGIGTLLALIFEVGRHFLLK